MANMSDRGGAFPSPEVLADLHREDLERYKRGEPRPIDVGNVRELTSEKIASLGDTYGNLAVASAVAAAAAAQLESIKLTTVTLPAGQKLMRVGDDSALSAEDVDWCNTRMLQQAQIQALRRETNVHATLFTWIRELCGDDYQRARGIMARLGKERIDALLRVHKKQRRAALARALEEFDRDEEA